MLGYTRVMFAEICRLCATNQPVEKVNIFHEQGKRLQLQNKIQLLVQTKVNEADNLPKVICSKCLLKLEDYYNFRNICQISESMLSTYYKNAHESEDFKLTGKVYIKNTPATQIDGKKYVVLMKNKNQENVMDNDLVPVPVVKIEYQKENEANRCTPDMEEAPVTKSSLIKTKNFIEHPPPELAFSYDHIELTEEAQQTFFQNVLEVNPEFKSQLGTTTPNIINRAATDHHEPAKKYDCKQCGRNFKRREHLYQHGKLHTGYRPYKCSYCGKAFMRKEHLIRHTTAHTGLKNYTCEICSKSFSRNDNLLKHRKTHDKTSDFQCFVCEKKFVMKHYYDSHMETMHKNLHQTMNTLTIVKQEPFSHAVGVTTHS